ncbi:MAG: DUF499 domain-containing protein [Eggerthellaceae bacterium]|nr:DUF499 domain-containing protein [Eggerthellaceae bacterium]
MDNYLKISKGFDILNRVLAKYITYELVNTYGENWWTEGVLDVLYDDQKMDLPVQGSPQELLNSMDVSRWLILMNVSFNTIFKKNLPRECRSWANELKEIRNNWAHRGIEDFSDSKTWRALDTMARLVGQIDVDGEAEINSLLREVRYGNEAGSMSATTGQSTGNEPKKRKNPETVSVANLPSWRDVIEPHPDVTEGRYQNAEFAADLAQVARGQGALEYRDPIEFFARTYITEGVKGLLVQALKRLTHQGGEPVIQLKTAFGGGKTHSLLALYHMVKSRNQMSKIANVRPILEEAGISTIPDVHVAVIIGTELNPAKSRRPSTLPGNTVNTLWGEIAYQLAESTGNPKLYDYVKDADKKGVAPGSKDLADMFDACGQCLILMDEIVAYAKKIYGHGDLPAGNYDNFIEFIQEITEAARASRASLVVASIPESNMEIGGEAGQIALDEIEHTFGRMEAIWKPVSANEGFEVVRRRLFLDCKDENARDEVCNAFSRMYNSSNKDFPVEAKELDYRDRMISCYPIHPEVFDRLYEDWATLEKFQRTRGVLRLMAAIIHELWLTQDGSPMIMPGSFPLDDPSVRNELTRYLEDQWNGIVDSEVDGKQSIPYKSDNTIPRYGKLMASRRVARTIMLGSAPDVEGQSVRGIESNRIRLGTIQPGEPISTFNDALGHLKRESSYLYSDTTDNRYWYDTRPTLRKVVDDRAQQTGDDEAIFEIERRLKKIKKVAPFNGLHIAPASSMEVPDEQSLRMIILPLKSFYNEKVSDNPAKNDAQEILNHRGNAQRINKNMLVFTAVDHNDIRPMLEEAKRYLAWKSIQQDREVLNLDAAQDRETINNIARSEKLLDTRIEDGYCWLLSPTINLADPNHIDWEINKIQGSGESIAKKAAYKLTSSDEVIENWAPSLLRMQLDNLLWKNTDDIQINVLWSYLCQYCYLPKLSNYSVLEQSIRQGLPSEKFFGLASGVVDGHYSKLTLGQDYSFINQSDYLVKPAIAERQLLEEKTIPIPPTPYSQDGPENDGNGTTNIPAPPAAKEEPSIAFTTFTMSAQIDAVRASKKLREITEEVVNQLMEINGADIDIRLDIQAYTPNGIPPYLIRNISENCNTLNINDFRFDQ